MAVDSVRTPELAFHPVSLLPLKAESEPHPLRTPEVRSPNKHSGSSSRAWTTILIPAAGVFAIATIVLWQQNERLDNQLAVLHKVAASQETQVANATRLLDLIGSPDTFTVNLARQAGMPKGTALVMYNLKTEVLMYDGQLGAAPAGKTYQLWIVPKQGNPVSAGVFQPVSGETDRWLMKMPQGVVPKGFAVTIEPASGVSQPTGPEVLVSAGFDLKPSS